jgi:hypothetical protein
LLDFEIAYYPQEALGNRSKPVRYYRETLGDRVMMFVRTTKKIAIRACWLLLMAAASRAASAADYYVSPSGDDRNNGTSVSSAWRTIAKANAAVRAGDTVYLRGGEYLNDPISPATSGRAGSPITYTGYQTERPVLTSQTPLGLEHAILLRGISHIVVQKIAIDGKAMSPQATVGHFATLDGASYVEIRDSELTYADGWSGIDIIGGSHHILILRNRIDFVGRWNRNGDDYGDSIWIGEDAHHNLIASNYLTHGGHELVRTKGSYSIVQDNVFDNDWSDVEGEGLGARNFTLDGLHNVAQRNIARGTKKSIDSPWNQAVKVEGIGNIARRNLILGNHHDAFTSEVGSWQANARDNRIYNNTIYNNGGAAWRIRYYTNDTRPSGNEFKNNLIYRNRQLPYNDTIDTDFWMYMRESGADAPADNLVLNNMVAKTAAGDSRVYFDPPIMLGPLSDAERKFPKQIRGNIQAVPVFVSSSPKVFRDFELAAGSPGVDAAAPLTTTTGTGSGAEITVADASYFNDGFGLGPGDSITVGNERSLRVLRVDFTGNKLLLDRSIGWGDGMPVHLDYSGSAPDVGAVESGKTAMFTERPKAPRLSGQKAN